MVAARGGDPLGESGGLGAIAPLAPPAGADYTRCTMNEWSDKPLEPQEYPDEEDLAEDEGESLDLVPCPSCGGGVFADSPRCPNCGHWLSAADYDASGGKLYMRVGRWATRVLLLNWIFWIAVTGVVAAAALLGWRRISP